MQTPDPLDVLPDGPRTDLGILRLQGGLVEDRGDHLVVRAPFNPDFHWGNYVVVTSGDPDDVDHWHEVFAREHPQAEHVAIGLPRLPRRDPGEWGLEGEEDDALALDGLPRDVSLAAGYTVRELATDDDWEQVCRAAAAENGDTGRYDPDEHDRFVRAQIAARRALVDDGDAAFFGAFHGDDLVADLGIVVLGEDARYQSVETAEPHRRKGLAGHLIGVAARWARERGARRFVIVTGATNPAGRLYRSVGFEPVAGSAGLYRPPAR